MHTKTSTSVILELMKKSANKDSKKEYTQWDAAKYYSRIYLGSHKLACITPFVQILTTLLIWGVPSLLAANIIDDLHNGVESNYYQRILLTALVIITGSLIARFNHDFKVRLEAKSWGNIQRESLHSLIDKPMAFHTSTFGGSNASKVNSLAGSLIDFSSIITNEYATTIGYIIFSIYVMGESGFIGAVFIIIGTFINFAISYPIIKGRLKASRENAQKDAERTGQLIDVLTNINAVKSFSMEHTELRDYMNKVSHIEKVLVKGWRYTIWGTFLVNELFYLVVSLVPLVYLIHFGFNGELGAARSLLIYSSIVALVKSIISMTRSWTNMEKALVNGVKGLEIIQADSRVTDVDHAPNIKVGRGEIDINRISFAYSEGHKNLYTDLTIKVKPAQKVGLVGPSGGGKTTLVKLIMRFMDVDSGEVTIDGQNIAKVSQRSLRESISYIPQEPILFHRTVFENICYGNPNATREQVELASKQANAHVFIEELPNGYDTLVGERGVKLSGGQRQRIAIARAFLKGAPILILDEATSALDSESEKLIQTALNQLMKNRTVITIAHRLSTLKIMDRLVVMDNGSITQEGTHDRLVNEKGTYADLWSHQSSGFIK